MATTASCPPSALLPIRSTTAGARLTSAHGSRANHATATATGGVAPARPLSMGMARALLPPRSPLLRRLLMAGALAASCTYFLLVIQAQASAPRRYDGFAYGVGAAAWKDAVLIEAFLDPLCPDSRDAWHPLRLAVERYSPLVSLIVHPFPLPYHTYSYHACRALHIANKLNSSSTYPVLELFFKNQGKFSNRATSSMSSTAVTGEISKMAAQAVGNSVSDFQSGFSDTRTDMAARVSFKYGCTRGVAGAPFFFVNGFLQPGGGSPIDYATWTSILDPLVAHHSQTIEMFTSV
ncbi:uncharacterized protein LOC123400205 [Hordeum vulgare subsp. vulgare]|nr:uncharacterized protein LOC123400205 [Hordeum vulgare subsp. vulgare]XP_044950566.1 uncharacterized protein LOC123400205 [Hordeum vulgare subsp. vulgare]XP_044950567.1 uncharacterized protein LOC123400205 [Hordeum vulgare subsp. vulgare]BAJ92850.1 predicted protein [Hordeum vulgare subsp. vulgare]